MSQSSIARVGEMKAKAGQEAALQSFIDTIIVPALQKSAGFQTVVVLQNETDPTRFTLIEHWVDAAAHQASVKNIDPEAIQAVMALLDGMPSGDYYRVLRK